MKVARNPAPGLLNSVEDVLPMIPAWRDEDAKVPHLAQVITYTASPPYGLWWDELCRQGDPLRRCNLSRDAYVAGYLQGIKDAGTVHRLLDIAEASADDGLDDRGDSDGSGDEVYRSGDARKRRAASGASRHKR